MKAKIKQILYKKLNNEQPYENIIDISLISNFSQLIEIFNTIENKTKFFYMDNKTIYEIMYQEEQAIPIESKKYEYSFIYYLSLLIIENKEMVNFTFGLDFIKEIDNENNNQENELKKLFISRIILDLIYSYEGIEKNEELKKIKEKNKLYVRDNIKVFNKYNLKSENIEEISLGKLYLDILIELIKNKKLEDYEFAYDILTKLDFENIDINQNMFEELKNILDDERYINDYKMNNIEDFFDKTKINFYYILIKYIFKNYFFIYNIPLLYNTRNTIIKVIKTKKEKFLSKYNIGNFDLNKRIIYNIKFILDSNYYYNIFIDIIFDNILEEAYKYNIEKWKEYMKDLNISENYIDKMSLIIYIYESKINNNQKIELKEITKAYKQQEKMIKDKKIKKMRKDDKLILSKYFIDNNNKESLLKIFGQDSYDFFLNESIKLNEIEKKEKNEKKYKLKEILDYYKTFFFESKKEDINSIENAINDLGDIDFKKYEPDFEKAKMINERMPLINYLYKIKDENNKTESEMQQIIEKYNSLEKFISEKNLMKDINIENETKSQLLDYFNDKNNKDILIKIFGKEKYQFFLQHFNEKILDDKLIENNGEISTDKLGKNTKPNHYGIKNQNIENDSLNLLSASTKMNSKNIPIENTNNSEQTKSIKEQLAYRLLKKSTVILKTKKEGEKLSFFFESVNYGDNHIFISYEKSLKIKEYFITNKSKSIIAKSYVKYMEFLDEFKNRINREFKNEYELKIDLEFQIIDNINNDSIYNINCYYKFYSPDLNVATNRIFKEENILLNKTNSKTQGFEYLKNEINEEYFNKIKFPDNSPKETNKISENNNINNEINNKSNIDGSSEITKDTLPISNTISNYNNDKESKKYNIVEINKIIGEGHKSTAEFIIELSNGCFISGGTDNTLKIYDEDFNKLKEITTIDWIYSCIENEKAANQKKKNDYDIELVACCFKTLYKIILTFKEKDNIKFQLNKYQIPNVTSKTCTQMRENNFVINGHNNSSLFLDLFNSQGAEIVNNSLVSGKSYIGSIKISQNIIALTSNKVQNNGEDKLIFYNIEKKKISREIEGCSFTSGTNGLALMPIEKPNAKNKILLCACTKYIDKQKNGIYLANPQLEDNKDVNNPFYDTGNFEVFCFCPILIINPNGKIIEKGKKKEIIDTEYFFVGGFNVDKKEGEIKLFRVIYSEKAYNNKIEFIQNIEFERNKDFSGFDGAVNCITQIKENIENLGNILVTCYSGKIYLLTKPNLDFYKDAKDTNNKK